MSIDIPKEKEARIIKSVKQYFEENLETEIGDLKASLLLDYILNEIGPVIYNQAVLDAQKFMTEKITDLDSSCYQPEFMYWNKRDGK
ncbi:DUF2164 domain-containing protein [bacterium]|nr:DUF2164 domain-containing protein [bacterium]